MHNSNIHVHVQVATESQTLGKAFPVHADQAQL